MASEYSTTVTPFRTMVWGLPISTFTATIVSLVLYLISIILIFATGCPMNTRVAYFLAFLIIAVLAVCCMAAINMMYRKYHFNCLSLSVSLIYSGSATLVILGLIVTAFNGLCYVQPAPEIPVVRTITTQASIEGSRAGLESTSSSSSSSSTRRATSQRDLFQDSETKSLFKSNHVGSYFIWVFAAIADAFQIVAHYYYG